MSGSSSSSCRALANCHSDEIFPPYRAIHGSPRSCASALIRSACGWAGVVLPQLGVGVRAVPQPGQLAQRRAVAPAAGSTVHAVKSVPMPMTWAGSIPAPATAAGHRVPQHVPVVRGVLQRPVRRQRLAGGGQLGVHHAVPVLVHGGAELGAVADPDHQGPPGQRAEVDADDVTALHVVSVHRIIVAHTRPRVRHLARGVVSAAACGLRAVPRSPARRVPLLPAMWARARARRRCGPAAGAEHA